MTWVQLPKKQSFGDGGPGRQALDIIAQILLSIFFVIPAYFVFYPVWKRRRNGEDAMLGIAPLTFTAEILRSVCLMLYGITVVS